MNKIKLDNMFAIAGRIGGLIAIPVGIAATVIGLTYERPQPTNIETIGFPKGKVTQITSPVEITTIHKENSHLSKLEDSTSTSYIGTIAYSNNNSEIKHTYGSFTIKRE